MPRNGVKPALSTYAAWLADVRQASAEQRLIETLFSADNTAVSFDLISFATAKTLPERDAGQE